MKVLIRNAPIVLETTSLFLRNAQFASYKRREDKLTSLLSFDVYVVGFSGLNPKYYTAGRLVSFQECVANVENQYSF